MTDLQLAMSLDTGRARRTDPRTSIDAASGVNVTRRCAEVLTCLREAARPVSSHDLADVLHGVHGRRWATSGTVSRRLLDLERRNLARRCGEVVGPFGRMVLVYEAVSDA